VSARVSRLSRAEVATGLAFGLLFLAPLLVYGPFDTEEGGLGIFASQVHYRALWQGHWPFWLNDLGFGTPMPIGHRLDAHPLFALSGVTSLRIALTLVWMAHVAAMVVYFLRLAAVSGIQRPLRLILLAFYLFSAVSVCLFYETDWLTCVIAWTVYPVIVFYVHQAIQGEAATRFWLASTRLALLGGFWVLNAHPGYLAPLALTLVVYVLVAAPLARRVYACLAVASVLCLAMSAERIYFLASEMQLFPASLARSAQAEQTEYSVAAYAAAAIAPFTPVPGHMRLPFIGLVLGGAAVAAVFRFARSDDRHARGCVAAFAAALVLSLLPYELVAQRIAASAGWLFRDPMLFFGLFSAGLLLQRALDSAPPEAARWRRAFVWTVLAIQACQQGATIAFGFRHYDRQRGALEFYRHQSQAVGVGRVLVDEARKVGPRVYLSKEAHELARGGLSRHGIHFATDLVFLGLNPLNGWFKGVSMDRLYPSPYQMHGHIRGERDVMDNTALLDVLGIDLVLTTANDVPPASGLVPVRTIPLTTPRGATTLVVLANRDAWPSGVLMDPAARSLALPRRGRCSHDAALCRDYGAFGALRQPEWLSIAADVGRYTVSVKPSERERLLFISALYRPEWKATANGRELRIDPVANAFLGVTLPPGVTDVDVRFVPSMRIALTWLSMITVIAVAAAVIALDRSTRTRRDVVTRAYARG
jgi:hypothetical protein